MQSSLNEASLSSIVNAIDKGTDIIGIGHRSRMDNRRNDKDYIGGSISRYAKNLILSFPVLCDNSLSPSTMQLISKANEKNIVSLLQLMFTDKSLSGSSGREIISKFHKNLGNADIEEIIDKIDDIVGESADPNYERKVNLICRDIIKEMVAELKKPLKTFPVESLNEKSLNDYQVRNDRYGNMHVLSIKEDTNEDRYNKVKADNDNKYASGNYNLNYPHEPFEGAGANRNSRDYEDLLRARKQDERSEEKRAEEREKRAEDKEKWEEERRRNENIDRRNGRQDLRDRDNANQQMQRQIFDSDYKKANELQPTLMQINFNELSYDSNGNVTGVIDRRSFICGVKSRVISVDAMDIVERIASKDKTKFSFKNFIRATSGETNLIKDFILATKQQKLNAKNAAKKGISAQMWNVLEKRSNKNNWNKLKRSGNDATAITTLIINAETASYLTSSFKFDINNPKNAKYIMDSYNLLGLFIADEANEVVKVMYDGNTLFESISYSALSKEYNDQSTYKKTVNLINQMGR